ncbi:MAG: VWA domain-containing protein [Gammaproteobacteria bacterium]
MPLLEYFHFLRPYWLLAFIPLLLVIRNMLGRKLGNRNWEAFCDAELLPHILTGGAARGRRLHLLLIALSGTLAILALAGPAWKKLPQPVFSGENALVIALDLSRSMDATDVSPNRVSRARFKISDLLAARTEGQTALLVYAGDAFVVTPLTDDIDTIESQLNALNPDIMPVWGNQTRAAIGKAQGLLQQTGLNRGHVLLITDEVVVQDSQQAVAELQQQGFQLSVLGVGTRHGVPVPLADGSFLKDARGEIIIPALDERAMRELAALGGGIYQRLDKEDSDVQALLRFFSQGPVAQGEENTELKTDVWYEHGPWLLLLLLPLAALGFRKGYLLVMVLFLLPIPDQAMAFSWRDLWLTPDQQAEQIMQDGDYAEAAALFKDKDWKAAAAYRAGDYADALKQLRGADTVGGVYNSGNALARLGRYEDAIAAYDKVLEQIPQHEDALFNKALMEQQLQQEQQQQQQQGEQGEQEEQEGEQQQGQEQQGEQQDSEQSQQADSGEGEEGEEGEQQQAGQDEQQPDQEADEQQSAAQQGEEAEDEDDQQDPEQAQQPDDRQVDEAQLATEQWLRRIPDDPSGLLRRKFRYQYGREQKQGKEQEKSW